MANVRFFLQNSSEYYSGFDEQWEVAQWAGTGTMTPSLSTAFADPHGSVMQASASTPFNLGPFKLFTTEPGAKYVFEAEYRSAHTVTFIISDVSNAGIVVSDIDCAPSTPHWANYFHSEILASNTTQVRLYIFGSVAGQTIYVDNVRFQGNAIMADPEIGQTPYSYQDMSEKHIMQDGSMRITKSPRRININLHFSYLTHAQFTRLQEFVNANEETWFDDQAVPNSIDTGFMYNEAEDDYTDTTNNKAYDAACQTLSAWATLFESSGTEFGGAAYLAIDGDDNNYVGSVIGAATLDYWHHKFTIKLTEISDISEVQSLDVLYKGCTNNVGTEADGVKLFLWDGNKYVEVDTAYASEKSTLNFNTTKPSLAQRFVNASGATLYIRAIAKSASSADSPLDIELDSYYFRTIVNENLSDTITLKSKAILDGGDVVEVKNITRDDVLTLGTDYRIGEDRQSVVFTSAPTAGDKMQVEYAKYWHVFPFMFSENRFDPAVATAPGRSADLVLEGIETI
jgi:hypothetical protein